MAWRRSGLWQHPDFVKLWTGQTISQFGSISAARRCRWPRPSHSARPPCRRWASWRPPGLPPRCSSACRGGVGRPPAPPAPAHRADWLGRLCWPPSRSRRCSACLAWRNCMWSACSTSLLSVCFDVANRSYLPALVERGRLVEANSRSREQFAGRDWRASQAGALVQFITAPFAVAFDALSFSGVRSAIGLIACRSRPLRRTRASA